MVRDSHCPFNGGIYVSQNVPKPPVPRGPAVAPASATVPPVAVDGDRILGPGSPLPQRLQRTVGVIASDTTLPSSVQGMLSGYVRFANPNMTCENLPRSLKPHPIYPERAASGGTKYDVFFALLGKAIHGMQTTYAMDREYAAVKNPNEKEGIKALLLGQIQLMESRVARLEALAKVGHAAWVVQGTDSEGFALLTTLEYAAKQATILQQYQAKVEAQRVQDEADDAAEAEAREGDH